MRTQRWTARWARRVAMGMTVSMAVVLLPSSPASAAPPTDGATRVSMLADQSPQSAVNFHTWTEATGRVSVSTNGSPSTVIINVLTSTIRLQNPASIAFAPGEYETDGLDSTTPPAGVSIGLFGFGPACGSLEAAWVIYEMDVEPNGVMDRFSGDVAILCDGAELDFAVRFHALPEFDPLQPAVEQLEGANRMETAIVASQDQYSAVGTSTNAGPQAFNVILARSDDYADALAGTPLAVKLSAPLLLTPGNALAPDTLAEIQRILQPGGTVHLLGGTAALSPAVADALTAAGYKASRHAGADRFATAVEIAKGLGDPAKVILVTGRNFPDGLSAGAAAGVGGGAILLTDGATMPPATASYLAAHPSDVKVAVGGPAAQAAPGVASIIGADRYETSAMVAAQLFPTTIAAAGLASGENFPDALSGGAHIGHFGGPLLLTRRTSTPASVRDFLNLRVHDAVIIYGGDAAVSEDLDPFS